MREVNVRNACLRWLAEERPEILALPYVTATLYAKTGQPLKVGLPGAADYILVIPHQPPMFVEFKSKTGRQREQQKKFELAVRQRGCTYALVNSVDSLRLSIALDHSLSGVSRTGASK